MTEKPDEYLTIDTPVESQLKVKGSRFLGLATPIQSSEQALTKVTEVSQKFYDATHHCFAFRVGLGAETMQRYSDAGEPMGTAGLPIYQVIEGRNLTNVLVLVTRYFGGTKLGKGGLVRAYQATAIQTLDRASVVQKIIHTELVISFPYQKTGDVMHVLRTFGAKIKPPDYSSQVKLFISVRRGLENELKNKLIAVTQNTILFDTN